MNKFKKQQLKWKFLPSNVVNDQLVTFLFPVNVFQPKFAAAGLPPKFVKHATCKFFWALFLLLVVSGPKGSMPIEKLGSSLLVSSIFQRERELHCSLAGWKL